jgi:hypothetical protein
MLGRLGAHEVSGVIGAGAMGVVLNALDKSLDRTVAIKVLAPHLASSGAARKRFAREAKAAAAVLHPNVIAIHSVSNDDSLPYLVMPYVRGASLQKRLDQEGPLPVAEILRIGSQIAAGLAAAHAQGLVHRDIKPANILLEEGVERVAITDFGLARAVDDATMTRTSVIAGTPQYMSPEQARGESVDHRSDLFSLGSVLYAMCTGRAPFRAETSFGVLRRITDEPHRPVRQVNPDAPDWLAEIIDRLLAKDAGQRFQSAVEVVEILGAWLARVQQPDVVPPPQHKRRPATLTSGNRGRTRLFKLIMGAAFACLLFFAGVLIVLELNKGTLTIECADDAVPVRIMKGEKVYDRMTVTPRDNSVRIAAGQYVVEIEGDNDGLRVENNLVTIERGGAHVVRIIESPPSDPKPAVPGTRVPALSSKETDLQISGILEYDERHIIIVHTHPPGRIEKLHVDFRGVEVNNGDPLVTLFSAELYAAEEEFLIAHKTNESQSSPKNARILETARERLCLMGLSDEQIDQLAKQNKASGRLTLFAPRSGIVTAMEAKEGESVNGDARLFTIADPTRLWARLHVNEAQLGLFSFNQPVTLTAHAYPGQTLSGKVLFIEPTIDPKTRSIEIRVEVSNPQSKLKPGMSVTVSVQRPMTDTDREALEKRRAVLFQLVKIQTEAYRQGKASLEGMVEAHQELVQVELELATTDDDRVKLLEESVQLARDLEKIATARYQAAEASQGDVLKAQAARLRAETDLLRQRQEPENN